MLQSKPDVLLCLYNSTAIYLRLMKSVRRSDSGWFSSECQLWIWKWEHVNTTVLRGNHMLDASSVNLKLYQNFRSIPTWYWIVAVRRPRSVQSYEKRHRLPVGTSTRGNLNQATLNQAQAVWSIDRIWFKRVPGMRFKFPSARPRLNLALELFRFFMWIMSHSKL